MRTRTIVRLLTAAVFLPLSFWATYKVSFLGIFAVAVAGPGEMQVFADLAVALSLLMPFLVADARRSGVNPWPWVLGTALLGSISPLAYFLWRDFAGQSVPSDAAVPNA